MLDMIKCSTGGAYYARGEWVPADGNAPAALAAKGFDAAAVAAAKTGTMAYNIMQAHNTSGDAENLKIKFDAMASHDITFVGIIQTARASGLEKFPIPYVLTNCHNSLCAVGGTINEDDHRFGLSAAKKYGGIFVPPHMAVIHQYMRERFAGCGKMILGSDSHTRYGALGTMAIGEGGGELAKQLLGRTYDVARPGVVAIYLTGSLPAGCGPHDVAIALVGKLFKSGYVKNKVMEFVGPGIASLRQDTRNAIDAMTTETTCLSSIWETDEVTQRFLAVHGRAADYKKLAPADLAYYDGVVEGSVTKAIRRYMSRQILIGDGTSGKFKGIFYNPTETKDQVIDPATDLSMTAVDDGTLDEIIYSFGGDEDVEDAAVLVLNKKDLKAFAKLRDKQGRKVCTIVNHGNTGTIDGVPYVINSACGAVTDTQTKAIVYCMAYGPLSNYEMAIFSDIDARKSLDYKFKQGQIAYRADIFAGGAVAAHNGFIRVKRPASA